MRRLERLEKEPAPIRLELDGATLSRRIRTALSVDFLLDGLDERPLAIAVLGETSSPGLIERRLLFGDPEVGSFEALLLLPTADGPHAAVIGLHGHRDDAETFVGDFLGRELVDLGFAVLIPEFRVHDCSRRENTIARELLKGGFTLMGIRVYETLLMVKYLESLDDVDAQRIGLLGHSGGSTIANLAVRISDAFAAKVTDYRVDFRNRCGPTGVHCETLPELFPLTAEFAFQDGLAIPFLEVPYKYEDPAVVAAISVFLESALAARE